MKVHHLYGDDEVLFCSWNAAVFRELRTGRRVGGRRTLSRRHVDVALSASLSSLGPVLTTHPAEGSRLLRAQFLENW